jgi:hypothetical protein
MTVSAIPQARRPGRSVHTPATASVRLSDSLKAASAVVGEGRTVKTAILYAEKTDPKPGRRHVYLYNVTVAGEPIVTHSHDPECDLARALLARGVTGVVDVIDGVTGKPRSRVNIEKAARLRVEDGTASTPHFAKWKPFPSGEA